MSAPLKLTARQLDQLAEFLSGLTSLRHKTQVVPDGYGRLNATLGDNTVGVGWDDEAGQYVIDDRIGD